MVSKINGCLILGLCLDDCDGIFFVGLEKFKNGLMFWE
jgi:hypothetical protein